MESGGLLRDLFDFDLKTFITLRVLKVVYIVSVVLILVGALIFLVTGLTRGASSAIVSLVAVPLFALLYLILARIYVEVIAMFFRIGDNTSKILAKMESEPGPGGTTGTTGPIIE